ncbi:hypothetical protein F2Q68_00038934 [Brassica cretica]|uniref:Uncharacterized protein n=1 Tax=Brassica cretica TaxID=69181 RepID=A0A8S9MAK1_BRACR|nr:hypothetical protein F2Q68_00038934 [Brassica cretica]
MSSSNYFRSWIDRPHLDPNTRLLTEEYQRGITEFMGLVHRQPEAKTVFEVDLSPTLKRPGQKSIIDFQRDVWWIQQAKNQEERPSEVEDIIIFPKPVIRRELWKDWEINLANYLQTKNTQPRQPPHDPRHPEDTSNDSEEPYIVLPYTNKHWNKRIFISGSFGSNSLKSASISSCRLLDHQQLGSFFSLVLLQEEPPDQSSIKQAVQRNKPINCPI